MTATADLMDRFAAELQSCDLPFRDYGGRVRFAGRVRTVRCREDNALVRATLAGPGHGDVLVVDGGGSLHSALVGDVIAGLALENGWSGIVVHGAIRDSAAIGALSIGLKALGTNPRRSSKAGGGTVDVAVGFGSAVFEPGAYLYADEDGIVVAPAPLGPSSPA
jgi:regulator of ribonuclease activity A